MIGANVRALNNQPKTVTAATNRQSHRKETPRITSQPGKSIGVKDETQWTTILPRKRQQTAVNVYNNIRPNRIQQAYHKAIAQKENENKRCYSITTGKLSPWMLYQSNSGTHFLDTLNEGHVKLIIDYINPEQWAIKFKRDADLTKRIKDTLREAGY